MTGTLDKIKAKVEAVVHPSSHGTSTSTNAGPHDSNIANKADPRVDSDRDGSSNLGAAGHTTGLTGTHGTTTGPGLTGHGTSTNAGPHDTNTANKLDPRVDSDRDGSRNLGAAGGAHTGTGLTGSHGTTGTGLTGSHSTSTNAGPHDSNIANKLDPRVDSDRDGSRNLGAAGGAHTGTGLTGSHGTTGTGLTGSHGTHGTTGTGLTGSHSTSTNAGPHDSNILNKLDPRVDSDRDGGNHAGLRGGVGNTHGTTGSGLTGTHGTTGGIGGAGLTHNTGSTNAGPHNSNILNSADPRVDSDRDGSRNAGFASHGPHSGTGPATNTAGPHSSNLANKLDPRVDSDLDGSKTVGQAPASGTGHTTGTY